MPTTDEAESAALEAARRYPEPTGEHSYGRIGFIAGARWQRSRAEWERNRPISDEAVRAAARSLAQDDPGFEDDYLDMARAALEAARGTKQ